MNERPFDDFRRKPKANLHPGGPRTCPRCGRRVNAVHIMVQAREQSGATKAGSTVSRGRSLCVPCGTAVFDLLVNALDGEASGDPVGFALREFVERAERGECKAADGRGWIKRPSEAA